MPLLNPRIARHRQPVHEQIILAQLPRQPRQRWEVAEGPEYIAGRHPGSGRRHVDALKVRGGRQAVPRAGCDLPPGAPVRSRFCQKLGLQRKQPPCDPTRHQVSAAMRVHGGDEARCYRGARPLRQTGGVATNPECRHVINMQHGQSKLANGSSHAGAGVLILRAAAPPVHGPVSARMRAVERALRTAATGAPACARRSGAAGSAGAGAAATCTPPAGAASSRARASAGPAAARPSSTAPARGSTPERAPLATGLQMRKFQQVISKGSPDSQHPAGFCVTWLTCATRGTAGHDPPSAQHASMR